MGKLFGTDGIRGVANLELTPFLAMKTGIAVAKVLIQSKENKKATVFIGKDTRISSDMIEASLASGLTAMGCDVVLLGVLPTPAVAFLVKKHCASAGIMISASHNSFEFNGIKIFNGDGYKLSDELEEKIEAIILNEEEIKLAQSESVGVINHNDIYKNEYINHLASSVSLRDNKLKILVDCSNGSASFTAHKLFSLLNLNADFIFDTPNGVNINKDCGSTNIEKLSKQVVEKGYDLAFAFDGDADRCLAIDESGKVVDGDSILGICAMHMKNHQELENNTLVATIMSNLGLKKFCEKNDITFKETKVGDRYVLEEMLKGNFYLGGEQSGHVIFKKYSSTGDGQLTAIKLIEALLDSGKTVSELNRIVEKYPQKSECINISLNQKGIMANNECIINYLKDMENKLSDQGRIVVRESGTEPKIRIMVEHKDENLIQEIINEISEFIKNKISG